MIIILSINSNLFENAKKQLTILPPLLDNFMSLSQTLNRKQRLKQIVTQTLVNYFKY